MIREEGKKKDTILYVLFLVILGIYPFRHVCFGTDWWDTGYNYANFVFMKQMDPMWVSGTFLGTALGNFMTKLPFGGTMVGLNFYTSLTLSFLGVAGFWFGVKKLRIPMQYVFMGELLAEFFSWCPTALLYNYLTYDLWFVGCVFLYLGLTKREKGEGKYFVLAGIFLGLNVLTRFPNLAQMGMILAVWAMAILEKKGLKKAFTQTGLCVLGYVCGLLIGVLLVAASLGVDVYIGGIQRLLSMPGEATDYSLYSMIYSQLEAYRQGSMKLAYLLALVIIVWILGYGCKKLFAKNEFLQRILPMIAAFLGFGICMWQFYEKKWFSFDYYGKDSYFLFATFFLILCVGMGICVIFGRKFSMDEKLVMGMGILIIFITPLGSNNHLYSATNNMFLAAPLYIFLGKKAFDVGKSNRWLSGVQTVLVLFMTVLLVQSGLFSATNVFCEAYGGKNLHTKITNNDILKGMKTSPDRAMEIDNLSCLIREEGLQGKELLLYGSIPSMSYYLDMPFVFTAWPDLRSYNKEVFIQNLAELEKAVESGEKELPVLLLGNPQGEALVSSTMGNEVEIQDEKLLLLREFSEKHQYEVKYTSGKFALLIPKE